MYKLMTLVAQPLYFQGILIAFVVMCLWFASAPTLRAPLRSDKATATKCIPNFTPSECLISVDHTIAPKIAVDLFPFTLNAFRDTSQVIISVFPVFQPLGAGSRAGRRLGMVEVRRESGPADRTLHNNIEDNSKAKYSSIAQLEISV